MMPSGVVVPVEEGEVAMVELIGTTLVVYSVDGGRVAGDRWIGGGDRPDKRTAGGAVAGFDIATKVPGG